MLAQVEAAKNEEIDELRDRLWQVTAEREVIKVQDNLT